MTKRIASLATAFLSIVLFASSASASIVVDSIKITPSSCTNNGSITFYVQSTSGALLYSLVAGPVTRPEQTSTVFSSLPAGTYTVKFASTGGEQQTLAIKLDGNYELPEFAPVVTDPDCPDNSTGIIDGNPTASSGLAPYTWELAAPSPVTRPAQSSPIFTGLPKGTYTLRMTDACNNIQTKSVIISASPDTMVQLGDFVNITACDSAEGNIMLLVSQDRPPYKVQYTAGGVDYSTDTATAIFNGSLQLVLPGPNMHYGDAFTNITVTNSCGTQLFIPRINSCPFSFFENYSVSPGPNCSSAVLALFNFGELGVCGNTTPKFPVTITIKDPVANTIVETKVYQDLFSGTLASNAMLPGQSYDISFKDGCNNIFNHVITTPAKERFVDYSSSGRQTMLDSTAITYIFIHGFPSTGTTLTITGGPVSAHSSKKGYAYEETYVYPKSFLLQSYSDSSLLASVFNTAPGTYYYTIADSCGNIYQDSLIVLESQVSDFHFKYDYTKGCAGESGLQYEFLHNTFSTFSVTDISTGALTYTIGVANRENPYSGVLNNLKATDYQMAIEYYGGGFANSMTNVLVDLFTVLDTVHILPYRNPSLQSSSSALCNGTLTLVLTADSTRGIPPYQYEIISGPETFPPQASNLFQLTQKGRYTIRLIDQCGNSTAADVTVDGLVFPPLSKIGNSCLNASAQLTYGASTYFQYTWTRPNGTKFEGDTLLVSPVTPLDTGIYTISRLTTINGCTGTQTATYRLVAGAQDSVNAAICSGQSYNFAGKTITLPGIYRDTIKTAFCDSIVVLNLSVNDSKKDSSDVSVCRGHPYLFGNRVLTEPGVYSDTLTTPTCDSISIVRLIVNDYKKDSLSVVICRGQHFIFGNRTLTEAGIYRDTLTTTTCDSISVLNLFVSDNKTSSIDATICSGESYNFGGLMLTQTGSYNDTLQTDGCDSIVTLHLTVNERPLVKAASDKYTVTKGETIQLTATPANLNSYLWTGGNPLSSATIANPTSLVNISSMYTVSVTGANNCRNSDTIFITIIADSLLRTCSNTIIYIPSAFTPNNDGKNDFFRVPVVNNAGFREFRLSIFNRFGQKIFESVDPLKYWNGYYRAKPSEQGNYVYMLRFICEDGRTLSQNGNILLIR